MIEVFNFPAILESKGLSAEKFTNRQKVEIIEYWMARTFENIADELPLTHYFYPGHYARALFLPAGTMATGKIHHHPGVFFIAYGEMSVLSENGMVRREGPFSLKYQAGIKRAAYAHTDTLCITFHRTNAATVEEAEKELFSDSDLAWVEALGMDFPVIEQLAA